MLAKSGVKRPAGTEAETPEAKRSAASTASPQTERVAALAAAALAGDRSALEAIMGGTSPLAPAVHARQRRDAGAGELAPRAAGGEVDKLDLAELRIQEVTLELWKVKGELSVATVDKQQLGQLKGSSRSHGQPLPRIR